MRTRFLMNVISFLLPFILAYSAEGARKTCTANPSESRLTAHIEHCSKNINPSGATINVCLEQISGLFQKSSKECQDYVRSKAKDVGVALLL